MLAARVAASGACSPACLRRRCARRRALERFQAFCAPRSRRSARLRAAACIDQRRQRSCSRSTGSFAFQRPGQVPLDLREALRAADRRRRQARVDLRRGPEPGDGARDGPRARLDAGGAARRRGRRRARLRARGRGPARRPGVAGGEAARARGRVRAHPPGLRRGRGAGDGARSTSSARPPCCASPTSRATRRSIPRPSASRRRKARTSSASDLFAGAGAGGAAGGAPAPAARIDEVVGQRHLLGPGKPLRLAFESGKPHSMILWGPPGVGKTTLARLMAAGLRRRVHRAVGGARRA